MLLVVVGGAYAQNHPKSSSSLIRDAIVINFSFHIDILIWCFQTFPFGHMLSRVNYPI